MNRLLVIALLAASSLSAPLLFAQRRSSTPAKPPAPKAPKPAVRAEHAVPFAVGETLTYDVSWSQYLTAGTVVATVKEKRAASGTSAYYVVAEGRPTPLLSKLYTLYYKMDTLIDTSTLLPQRGSVYSEEGKRHRYRTSIFDRAAKKVAFEYKTDTLVKAEFPVSPVVQDGLSALYVLRAIPLKAGDRMTMPVTDDGINYGVRFDAMASEKVRTGLGELQAQKLAVAVTDDKNKPVGRNLAIWFSDDARRLPVKVQAELPVGSFVLTLHDAR